MERINFQDGTKISSAKVTIDGVDYPVTPARYTGATPLSSLVMNTMQDNIEDAINQNVDNIGGEDYDDTATYEVGDIVKYEGQLYICIETIDTPEEWDSTKWNATDVLSSAGGNEVAIGTNADITGKTKLFVEESTQTLKYKSSTTGQFENLTSEDIVIGEPEDVTSETKIFIDESEGTDAYSEVVDSLSGNEIAKAPSVRAVNEALSHTSQEKVIGTWEKQNGTIVPLYSKTIYQDFNSSALFKIDLGVSNAYIIYSHCELRNTNQQTLNIPYYVSNTSNALGNLSDADTKYAYQGTGALFNKGTLILEIHYYKTTD